MCKGPGGRQNEIRINPEKTVLCLINELARVTGVSKERISILTEDDIIKVGRKDNTVIQNAFPVPILNYTTGAFEVGDCWKLLDFE